MSKFKGTKLNKDQYVLLTGCKVKGENALYKVIHDIENDDNYMGDNGYVLQKVKLNGELKVSGYTLYFYDNNTIKIDTEVKVVGLNSVEDLTEANKQLKAYIKERDNKTIVNKIEESKNKINLNDVGAVYKIKINDQVVFSTNGYSNNKAFKKGQFLKVTVLKNERIQTELQNKKGESYCFDTACKYTHNLNKELTAQVINNSVIIDINKVTKEELKENVNINNEVVEKVNNDIEENTTNKETKNNIQVEVKFNIEKNGIELHFTDKPSEEIRAMLKSNGYRWAKYNKCWYCKDTEEQRQNLINLGWLNNESEKTIIDNSNIEIKKVEDKNIQIDERLAKRSKENMSFSDYVEGSATKEFETKINGVKEQIEIEKKKVNENGKILLDNLFIKYKNQLAEWTNKHNTNGANHVSVMISGAGNYNMKKHERYVQREGNLWKEYEAINDIDYKINKIVKKYKSELSEVV